MAVPIDNLGALGMLFDREPYEIPPEAWSDLRNVRCHDRALWTTFGHSAVMGVPLFQPFFIIPTLDNAGSFLWAYCSTTDIGATDGATHTEITRAAGDYTGTSAALWNGGNFGGILILNNGVDVPQAWNTPSLATLLVNLPNWPANTIAKVIRVFGRYLVAMDVTVSGTRRSTLVKWSDQADIGTVPSSWDPADTTRKAGEWPLLDTEGEIVDAVPLGSGLIIYKSDSAYSMELIGGRFVFRFRQLQKKWGLLAQRCAGEYGGGHVVATAEDVLFFDGFQDQSLLDDKMLRWYSGRVDPANAFRTFIAMNYTENEAWVCMPEQGEKFPNIALIINMKDGTNVVRDLPVVAHIDYGKPPTSGSTFDSFSTPFDQMVGFFGQAEGGANRKRLVGVTPEAERNQFLRSEELDNVAWTVIQLTIQANVEGTAEGVRPTAVSSAHFLDQSYSKLAAASQTWTLRVKASDDGYSFLVLRLDDAGTDGAHVTFDVATGAVVGSGVFGSGFTVLTAAINGAVDALGYYDCYLTVNTDSAAVIRGLIGVNATSVVGLETFTGNGTSRIRVKEVQLRRGALGTYQTTVTTRALGGIFLYDSGFDFDGVAFTSKAERLGLSVIGQTRTGEPKSDISVRKFVSELWPKMDLSNGTAVSIYVGSQEVPAGSVTWFGPFMFNPLTDLKIDPLVEGRLIAVRYETSQREAWRLNGYNLEVQSVSKL